MMPPMLASVLHPASEGSPFGRLGCLFDDCRRTTRFSFEVTEHSFFLETGSSRPEWLCQTHWKMVPLSAKRGRSKILRRYRKLTKHLFEDPHFDWSNVDKDLRNEIVRLEIMAEAAWRRCLRTFNNGDGGADIQKDVERAMGW